MVRLINGDKLSYFSQKASNVDPNTSVYTIEDVAKCYDDSATRVIYCKDCCYRHDSNKCSRVKCGESLRETDFCSMGRGKLYDPVVVNKEDLKEFLLKRKQNREMGRYMLSDICNTLYKADPFETLKVRYLTPDGKIEGSALVTKVEDDGFLIGTEEDKTYHLTDLVEKYEYKSDNFDGLMVWLATKED